MNYEETKVNNDKSFYFPLNQLPTENKALNQPYMYPSTIQYRLGTNDPYSVLPNFINSHIRGNCSHVHGNVVHSHKCTPYPHIHPNGDMRTYQPAYPQLPLFYNGYPYPRYNTNQYPPWMYENEANSNDEDETKNET